MKLDFKKITLRNFLSFGNVPQSIDLNKDHLRVITGENKDKSENPDDKNGIGKSTIFEAIHYALFGDSINNKIRLGSLINNINKKNMYVILTFEKDGVEYEITRGRLPNVLLLKRNGEEIIDESQGDSRETQKDIEKILGIDEMLFDQIMCLTRKVPMYYNQSLGNQKMILEKILGIDMISKKIEALKERIKSTKNEYNNEEFRINTLRTQNENLKATIDKQIEAMEFSRKTRLENLNNLKKNYESIIEELSKIDFDKEMENFKLLEQYLAQEGVNKQNQQLKDSIMKSINNIEKEKGLTQNIIDTFLSINIEEEHENHLYNDKLKQEQDEYLKEESSINAYKTRLNQWMIPNINNITKSIEDKRKEIDNLKDAICPTCGQIMDKENAQKVRESLTKQLNDLLNEQQKQDMEIIETNEIISKFIPKTFEYKTVHYKTMTELAIAESSYNNAIKHMTSLNTQLVDLNEQLKSVNIVELGEKPKCIFSNIQLLMAHKTNLETAKVQLENTEQALLKNPYEQQEQSIEEMKKGIVEIDDSTLRELEERLEDENMLLKLLNSPSSFIRKAILDKSLAYLNQRLMDYLVKLGSLHKVSFNNDMSLTITKMGLDYDYVSTGEEGRITFALMFAFRDVWESLNNCKINLLAFDEIIDGSGLDINGVDMLIDCIKGLKKNMLLVTHNDKLLNQLQNKIELVKEHDFTTIKGNM